MHIERLLEQANGIAITNIEARKLAAFASYRGLDSLDFKIERGRFTILKDVHFEARALTLKEFTAYRAMKQQEHIEEALSHIPEFYRRYFDQNKYRKEKLSSILEYDVVKVKNSDIYLVFN